MVESRDRVTDPAISAPSADRPSRAFEIIDATPSIQDMIAELRDLLDVDHLVYHSSKLGMSPSVDPYIRLTYPDSWIKRYLQMGYIDIDPVIREGFARSAPFDWEELTISRAEELAFLQDAFAHNVGPHGLSIPVVSKRGHRALFSVSSSRAVAEWKEFAAGSMPFLVQIANRIHQRVVASLADEGRPHLTARELTCLQWVALGKSTSEIAVILDISTYTVRDYLKSARFKLDCVTSAQAVNKAIRLGLLNE
jgi:LuxR family transcriptional regulator, quorum-sensing system regulator CinR